MYRNRKKRSKIDEDLDSSGFIAFFYKLIFFKFSFKRIMDGVVEEVSHWRIFVFDAARRKKLGSLFLSILFHIVALIGINEFLSTRPKASIVSPNTVFEMNAIQLVDIAPVKAEINKSSGGKPLEKPIKKIIKPGVPRQLASFSPIDKATLTPPTRPSSLSDYFHKATLVAQGPDRQVLPNTKAKRVILKPREFKPVFKPKPKRPLPKTSPKAKQRWGKKIVKPAKLVPTKKTRLASAAQKTTSTPRKSKFPQRKLPTLTAKQREKIIKQALLKKAARQVAKIKKIKILTKLAKLLKVKPTTKAATLPPQKREKKKVALPTDRQIGTLQKKLQKLAQLAKQKTKPAPAPTRPEAPKTKPSQQIEKEAIEAKLKALRHNVNKLLAAAKVTAPPALPPKPLKKSLIVKNKKKRKQPPPRDRPTQKITPQKAQKLARTAKKKVEKITPQKIAKAQPTLKPVKQLQRKLARAKVKTEVKQLEKKLAEAKKKIVLAPKPKIIKKKIIKRKVKKQLFPTAKSVKKLARQKYLKLAQAAKQQVNKEISQKIKKAKPAPKPIKELQRKLARVKVKTKIKKAEKKWDEAKKKIVLAPKPKIIKKKIIKRKVKKQLFPTAKPVKKLARQKYLKLAQTAKRQVIKKIPQRIEKAKSTLKPVKELQRKLARAKVKTEIKKAEKKWDEAKKKITPVPKPKVVKKKIVQQKEVVKKQLLPTVKPVKKLAQQKALKLAQTAKRQVIKKIPQRIEKAKPTLKPVKELERKLAQAKVKTKIKKAEKKWDEAKKKITSLPKPKALKKKIVQQKEVVKKQLLPTAKAVKKLAQQKALKLAQAAKRQAIKEIPQRIEKAKPTLKPVKELERRLAQAKVKTKIKKAEKKLARAKKKVTPPPKPKSTRKKIIKQKARKQPAPATEPVKKLARQKDIKLTGITRQPAEKRPQSAAKVTPGLKPIKQLTRRQIKAPEKTVRVTAGKRELNVSISKGRTLKIKTKKAAAGRETSRVPGKEIKELQSPVTEVSQDEKPLKSLPRMIRMASAKKLSVTIKKEARPEGELKDFLKAEKQNRAEKSSKFHRTDFTELRKSAKDLNYLKKESKVQKPKSKTKVHDSKVKIARKNRQADELVAGKTSLISDTLIKQPDNMNRLGGLTKSVKILGQDLETPSTRFDFVVETTKQIKADKNMALSSDHKKLAKAAVKNKLEYARQERKPRRKITNIKVKAVNDSEAARNRKSTGPSALDTAKTLSKILLEHQKEEKLSSFSQIPPKKKLEQKTDPLTKKLSLKSQTLTPQPAAGQKVLVKLFNKNQNQTLSNKDLSYLDKSVTRKTRLAGKKGRLDQTANTLKNKAISPHPEGLAAAAFKQVDEIRFEQTAKQNNAAPSTKLEVDLPKRFDQELEARKKLIISSFQPTPDLRLLRELPIQPATLRNREVALNKISYLAKKTPKREKTIDLTGFFDLEPEKAPDTQPVKLKEAAKQLTRTTREISQFATVYLKTDLDYEKAETKADILKQAEAVEKEEIKVVKLTKAVKVKNLTKVAYEQTIQKQAAAMASELAAQTEQIETEQLTENQKIILAKADQQTTRTTISEQEKVQAREQQVTRKEQKQEEQARLEQLKQAETKKQVKEEIKLAAGAKVHDLTKLAFKQTAQPTAAAQAAELAAQAEKIEAGQLVQVEGVVLAKADQLTTRTAVSEQERVQAREQQVTRKEQKQEEQARLEQLKQAEIEKQVQEEARLAAGAKIHDLTKLAFKKTAQPAAAAQAAELAAQAEQLETEALAQKQMAATESAAKTERDITAAQTALPQAEPLQEAGPSGRKTGLELAYEAQISQLGKMMGELEKKLAGLQTTSEKPSIQHRKTAKKALDLTSMGIEKEKEIEGEEVLLSQAAQEKYASGRKVLTPAEAGTTGTLQQVVFTQEELADQAGKEEKIVSLTTELVELTQIMKSLEYQAQMAQKTTLFRKTAQAAIGGLTSAVPEVHAQDIKSLNQLLAQLETTGLDKTGEDILASHEKPTQKVMAQLSEVSLPQANLLLAFSGETFDREFAAALAYFKEESAKERLEFVTPSPVSKVEQEAIQYTQRAVYAQPRSIDKAADFPDLQESWLTGEQIDQTFDRVNRSMISPKAADEQIPLVKNEISGDFVPFTEAEKLSRIESSGVITQAKATPGDRTIHLENRAEISPTAMVEQTRVKYKNLESSQHRRPTPVPENIQSDMKKFRDLSGEQSSRSQSNLTEFSKKTFTYQEKAAGRAIEIGRHLQAEFPQAETDKETEALLQSKDIRRVASTRQIETDKEKRKGQPVISKSAKKPALPGTKSKRTRSEEKIDINIDRPSGNMTDQPLYTLTGRIGGKIKLAFITINKVTQIVPVAGGRFAAQITMRRGINNISVVAFDPKGGIGKQSSQILFRPRIAGPAIKLISPATRTKGKEGDPVQVRGLINDRSVKRAILFLNNSPIRITVRNGEFRYKVYLPKGKITTFRVMGVNRQGGVGYSPLHTVVTGEKEIFNPTPF